MKFCDYCLKVTYDYCHIIDTVYDSKNRLNDDTSDPCFESIRSYIITTIIQLQ